MTETPENTFKFPCSFPIKIFGRATEVFEAEVVTIVRRHVENLSENALRVRPSKQGNYPAMTITIEATSREQLDAIYYDLTASNQVIMAI